MISVNIETRKLSFRRKPEQAGESRPKVAVPIYNVRRTAMRFKAISRMLGLVLLIFGLSLIPPIIVELIYRDGKFSPFIISLCIVFIFGLILWLPVRNSKTELKIRDGFLVVVLIWVTASIVGAIPFYLNFYPHLSFTDALFESVSGLSTSGATVFTHIDAMPHGILYYRQQLTLLGGVGVVVIALSILPVLGIGGMQLYIAETGGPVKTSRLRPRLRQTAKALWLIYLFLVFGCALCYWLAGMNLFDAIGQSFSAIATARFNSRSKHSLLSWLCHPSHYHYFYDLGGY